MEKHITKRGKGRPRNEDAKANKTLYGKVTMWEGFFDVLDGNTELDRDTVLDRMVMVSKALDINKYAIGEEDLLQDKLNTLVSNTVLTPTDMGLKMLKRYYNGNPFKYEDNDFIQFIKDSPSSEDYDFPIWNNINQNPELALILIKLLALDKDHSLGSTDIPTSDLEKCLNCELDDDSEYGREVQDVVDHLTGDRATIINVVKELIKAKEHKSQYDSRRKNIETYYTLKVLYDSNASEEEILNTIEVPEGKDPKMYLGMMYSNYMDALNKY